MNPLLDRLIAQWRRCGSKGGGTCKLRNCKRCKRGLDYAARNNPSQ